MDDGRVVPIMEDSPSPEGLSELDAHLDELIDAPETPFQTGLFDQVTVQLSSRSLTVADAASFSGLLQKLATVLHTTPHDPSLPVALTTVLLKPLPFEYVLPLANEESLITALRSEYASANVLAMQILGKAASSQSTMNVQTVADMDDVLAQFVRRWLLSPDVQVSETAHRELTALLVKDTTSSAGTPLPTINGNGATTRAPLGHLWTRVFAGDLLGLILTICTGHDPDDDSAVPERQLSLAQDRVLRILPVLAVQDFHAVSAPRSDIDTHATNGRRSLFHFAALDMIDKADYPLYLAWHEFYRELIVRAWQAQGGRFRHDPVYLQLIREATGQDDRLLTTVRRLKDEFAGDKEEDVADFSNYIDGLLQG